MGLLKQAINAPLRRKIFDPMEGNIDLSQVVGWHSVGGSNIYGYYKDHQYENGYSSISKLANGFAAIEPYTIDSNGKSVPSNVLDRIYTANTDMSAYDFREALAVCNLVHDKVRLRVHHKGKGVSRINADSIIGFTFMEGFSENIVDGKRTYKLPNGDTLTDDEVITLKSVNPDSITDGFSPSRAARRWTRLDDYIADYQKGFFENGAVPKGQLIITARTKPEFNDIVDMLQARHKGAGKNENITYTHRPTDQNGAPLNSQIEWVPFSTENKNQGLKEIFQQVNQKIDSVYGVPASIRGVNDQNTYASVRVDEVIFVKYALKPMTLKIWSKFTHELTRITGGMGVAISYDLEIPQIADEEKVKSESKSVEAGVITTLTEAGYSLNTIVDAFDFPVRYKLLRTDNKKPVIDNDKPQVLTPEEARGTPDQPIDPYAKQVKVKQIGEADRELYIDQMRKIIYRQMGRQVEKAVGKLDEALKSKAYGDTTEEEDEVFTAEMLSLLLPLIAIYGNRTVNTGINLLVQSGLSTENVRAFEFTPAQRKAYQKYLAKVGTGYAEQTAESIRKILGQGILDGASKQEIESQLRRVILGGEHEYRVLRLSRTEVNLSEGRASVSAMENIQDQTGYKIYKEWNVSSSDPCEFCLALAGSEKLVDENFLDLDEEIHGVDGGTYLSDFKETDTAEAHPNCSCYTTYRVERT